MWPSCLVGEVAPGYSAICAWRSLAKPCHRTLGATDRAGALQRRLEGTSRRRGTGAAAALAAASTRRRPDSAIGVVDDADVQPCYSAAIASFAFHRSARVAPNTVMCVRSTRTPANSGRRSDDELTAIRITSYARRRASRDRRLRCRRLRGLGGAARVPPPPARASSSAVPVGTLGRAPSRARSTHRHDPELPALRPLRAPRRPDRGADHDDVGRAHEPDAIRRGHRVATGMWGRLRVESGSLRFVAGTDPIDRRDRRVRSCSGHSSRRRASRPAMRPDTLRHRLPRLPNTSCSPSVLTPITKIGPVATLAIADLDHDGVLGVPGRQVGDSRLMGGRPPVSDQPARSDCSTRTSRAVQIGGSVDLREWAAIHQS